MQFNFPWFSLIYVAGALLTLALAIVVRRRQFATGVIPFSYLLLSMTLWTLAIALEVGAVEIPLKILFAKAEYIAVVSTGALSLTFILEYSHSPWILRRRNVILLWIIPLLSLATVWTNELHGLVWSKVYMDAGANETLTIWEHGLLYFAVPLYQYLLYFSGIIILFRYGRHRPSSDRRQAIWLLSGSIIPVAGSIAYISGVVPVKGLDITPITICLMGVVWAIAIFRYRLMDILPSATTIFVKNLPDGFLLLDADGRIVSFNPAAERIIKHTNMLSKGQQLSQIWPELDNIVGVTRDGKHIELIREKAGTKTYLDISVESFMDRYESLTGKLIIMRDITELKQTQFELEAEISKRSQFTRAIVHELRNPLTAIISSSDELQVHAHLNEQIRTALVKNISRASADLEQRVNELFELARGELGLLVINHEIMDMNQLIKEIGAEMAPVAAKNGLTLSWQVPETPYWVWGDTNRLRQVMSNLIGNAIKFTAKGEITIRTLPYAGDLLLVQVEDSGRGIEKEALENLFDPYLRSTREKTQSTGLGIGLALSKRIVDLHKGNIWAASVKGKGTTINFIIPLYHPDPA